MGKKNTQLVKDPLLGLSKLGPICSHRGHKPVQVGPYQVYLGGTRYLEQEDFDSVDVIVPLTDGLPEMRFGKMYLILAASLPDYGGVPEEWEDFLRKQIIPLLQKGKKILAYCVGSHGRTGTFLASLISILEKDIADPIAEARKRHCHKAVESLAQAKAIFALRGQKLPQKYEVEFTPKPVTQIPKGYEHLFGK